MYDLTAIQRDIIFILADRDGPHGLAIKDRLDDYYGEDVNPGRLYPNLDTLVEKGPITKTQADKRTNSYSLTNRTRRELEYRRGWEQRYLDGSPSTGGNLYQPTRESGSFGGGTRTCSSQTDDAGVALRVTPR